MFLAASVHYFDWLGTVASLVIGLFLGLVTEPFRLWLLRPIVVATFTRDEHCLRETPVRVTAAEAVFSSYAKVVRFFVRNTRRFVAKSCRSYLSSIEQRAADGSYSLIFADRLPLTWAYIGADAIDIPGHFGLYCDLAASSEADKRLSVHTQPRPELFGTLLREKATYRFTVIVTGANINPVTIQICIDWKGDWNIQDVWEETQSA